MNEWIGILIKHLMTKNREEPAEKQKPLIITKEMREQSAEIQRRLDNEMA